MSKLVDRFEPLESILEHYHRFGNCSNLLRYLARFIQTRLKTNKQDRITLFQSLINNDRDQTKSARNLIADIVDKLPIDERRRIIRILIDRLWGKIEHSDDLSQSETDKYYTEFNKDLCARTDIEEGLKNMWREKNFGAVITINFITGYLMRDVY